MVLQYCGASLRPVVFVLYHTCLQDDDPLEHASWATLLSHLGRNSGSPWIRQAEALTIDDGVDYVSDSGVEIWNILEAHGITNVVLVGVHTNMCVIGRPFGLRQLKRAGKHNVTLMRDSEF